MSCSSIQACGFYKRIKQRSCTIATIHIAVMKVLYGKCTLAVCGFIQFTIFPWRSEQASITQCWVRLTILTYCYVLYTILSNLWWLLLNLLRSVNPCYTNPCVNGGTCTSVNGGTSYTCSCPPGYFGSTCASGEIQLSSFLIALSYLRVCKCASDVEISVSGAGMQSVIQWDIHSIRRNGSFRGLAIQVKVCTFSKALYLLNSALKALALTTREPRAPSAA